MAKILLIDDEKQVRSMLKIALEEAGHEVYEACSGKEALKSYRSHPTDLIITDILMPDMDGLEAIMQFKQADPSVKIIAMSGGGYSSGKMYLDSARQFGATYALEKPFGMDELLATVQAALESSVAGANHRI